jgi:hypothetical protein
MRFCVLVFRQLLLVDGSATDNPSSLSRGLFSERYLNSRHRSLLIAQYGSSAFRPTASKSLLHTASGILGRVLGRLVTSSRLSWLFVESNRASLANNIHEQALATSLQALKHRMICRMQLLGAINPYTALSTKLGLPPIKANFNVLFDVRKDILPVFSKRMNPFYRAEDHFDALYDVHKPGVYTNRANPLRLDDVGVAIAPFDPTDMPKPTGATRRKGSWLW